jgi:hypothetical protein
LAEGPLLYRFSGARKSEGAFVACSFWLVDALVRNGQTRQARKLWHELIAHVSDLGLLAEEIDPASGEFLGNLPQGLSHLALLNAAAMLNEADSVGPAGPARLARLGWPGRPGPARLGSAHAPVISLPRRYGLAWAGSWAARRPGPAAQTGAAAPGRGGWGWRAPGDWCGWRYRVGGGLIRCGCRVHVPQGA